MTKYSYLLFLLLPFQLLAQQKSNVDSIVSKITLVGIYSGKNMFVQNPLSDISNQIYCTDSVVVNGIRCMVDLNQSAYEIKLDSVVNILGAPLEIFIYHKKTCRPKPFVYPAFPQKRSKVEFTSFDVDTTGHVHITTRNQHIGDRPPFQFDQLRANTWTTIMVIPQKWGVENTYDTVVSLTAGLNTFRLSEMQYGKLGKVITVKSEIPQIICTLDASINCITCSDMAYFEIQDSTGLKLDSGYSKKIDVSKLKNGTYVFFYETQRLMVDIKRSKK
jgi:hypothetical protein